MCTKRYIFLVVLLHLFSVISYYHQVNAKTYETNDAIIVEGEYYQMTKHSILKFISIQKLINGRETEQHIKNDHKQAWKRFYYIECHSNSDFTF